MGVVRLAGVGGFLFRKMISVKHFLRTSELCLLRCFEL